MRFAQAVPKRAQHQRAVALLSRLGLSTRLAHRPAQLSRGEQQRVAIARALANDPPVLLADEPCASLDAATAHVVLVALHSLCRESHKTVLIVAHDTAVLEGADQVLEMRDINRATGRPDGVDRCVVVEAVGAVPGRRVVHERRARAEILVRRQLVIVVGVEALVRVVVVDADSDGL